MTSYICICVRKLDIFILLCAIHDNNNDSITANSQSRPYYELNFVHSAKLLKTYIIYSL